MVERHEQAPAPLPNLTDVLLQGELMILDRTERIKRDGPERDDDARINDLDLPAQEFGAVRDLAPRRAAVRARLRARVAEGRVGDEDVLARGRLTRGSG